MNEQSLLSAAVSGDRSAREELLLEHYDRLAYRIAKRLTGNLARQLTPEDVLQEALIMAIRDFGSCRAKTQSEFGAWLNAVVDNRISDLRKRMDARKRGAGQQDVPIVGGGQSSLRNILDVVEPDDPSPSSRIARRDALRALSVGVACLPEDQRQAIQRRFLDGASIDGVAQGMKKSPAAVRGLIHRAKLALRDTMGHSSRWFRKK